MGVVITVFLFFGIISIYFARMWRVYKVFSLYQEFLNIQKKQIDDELYM
jgi:hypothetical protein